MVSGPYTTHGRGIYVVIDPVGSRRQVWYSARAAQNSRPGAFRFALGVPRSGHEGSGKGRRTDRQTDGQTENKNIYIDRRL